MNYRKSSTPISVVKILVTMALAMPCFCPLVADKASADIVLGQVDAFTDGTAAGWIEGSGSPNPPVYNNGLGPDGNPGHLQNQSDGAGTGGKMVMYNDDSRWQGNYNSVGVINLRLSARNESGPVMNIRVAFGGPGGWFVSNSNPLVAGAGWSTFDYNLGSLAYAPDSGGTGVLADTMSAVSRFEILSALNFPSFGGAILRGDAFVGDLRVDNITAIPEPGSVLILAGIGLLCASRIRSQVCDTAI